MTSPAPIAEIFSQQAMLLDVQAATKMELLEAMVTCAIEAKALPRARRQEVLEVLRQREERGSTALGNGVAVPHARIKGLKRAAGVVARSVNGLDFKAVDGEPVHVFLMVISPEARADEHLAMLRWISSVVRSPDFLSFIRQAGSHEDVLEVLQEHAP